MMQPRPITLATTALLSLIGIIGFAHGGAQESGSLRPGPIPRAWDEQALATLEVPLADPKASPVHVTAEEYYRLPVRPIYQSYPIYHPSREPQGYWEWLQRQEPRVIFDAAKLKTEAEWLRAGETVFAAPSAYDAGDVRADMRNPNQLNATAERGRRIFAREACGSCHTPPLYTNNKLTPADGFMVPPEHLKTYDILPVSVGTDPNLTLRTARGTGYYKIPALRGLGYRGPYLHDGSCATLQDLFDPRRTREEYVPTGFKGYGVKTRAVKGHPFGLSLAEGERKALIAFLETL